MRRPTPPASRPGWRGQGGGRRGADVVAVVAAVTSEEFSVDELKRVARSITPAAELADTSTWFEAEQALPLR